MEQACKSCTHTIDGNFCSECGQKKYKRIDRKYLVDEIQYIAIHTNKGFFYSVKNILKNPGKTARDFIEGNRVNHYKPLYLAFLLSGISAFISFKIIGLNKILDNYYKELGIPNSTSVTMMNYITSYNSVFWLLLLPIFAIFSYVAFRKWGQNYFEHIVMNAFFLCYYNIITIFTYPLIYIFKDNTSIFMYIMYFLMMILPIISVVFYKGFYKEKPLKAIIARVIGLYALSLISYILLLFFVIILGLFYKKYLV